MDDGSCRVFCVMQKQRRTNLQIIGRCADLPLPFTLPRVGFLFGNVTLHPVSAFDVLTA